MTKKCHIFDTIYIRQKQKNHTKIKKITILSLFAQKNRFIYRNLDPKNQQKSQKIQKFQKKPKNSQKIVIFFALFYS